MHFFGSVRWRLTLWYSLSIALIYFLFAGYVFLTFRYSCISESRMRLDNELTLVINTVSKSPVRLASLAENIPVSNFYVLVDQHTLYVSPGWKNSKIPSVIHVDEDGYGFGISPAGRHYAIRKTNLWISGQTLQIGIAQDTQQTFENLNKLLFVLLFSLPGILVVSLGGGYIFAGRMLSPIDDMARKAKEITADSLSHRLTVGEQKDEFARLAGVFNETFDRLEDAFSRMKQFTADASHELRTPLAIIRNLGENALRRPVEAIRYEDAIGSILEEADRLTRLLDGLLILTRTGSEQILLNFEDTSLAEISLDVVNCLRVLAEEKEQTLLFMRHVDSSIRLDRSTFKQALINLVANAIQYTQASGKISVVVDGSEHRMIVEVQDNGPGIAAEHREHIFERFYRIEKDRSQVTGGSGLGLAIARWAIGLNGGTVEFEAKKDQGSIFRIALPRH